MAIIKPEDQGFQPPGGVNFSTEEFVPLNKLSNALCKIAAFLQNDLHVTQLVRYDDWWQHDGLHFRKADCDIHGLFAMVQTPRSLLLSMPGDELVYVGIAPPDSSWYVRFYVCWDDLDSELIGVFDLTLSVSIADRFRSSLVPEIGCKIREQDAAEYFKKIIL
ncbi:MULTISPECIES: hypothetical protein [Gimesia]|uniref:Uncharacterized protein n=1 Tax=Gimesia benthica TaxID=2608982 RepID=A0A6I6AF04_9PLAN|nr:hypothetical protein [Gimesia benthica]QGQ25194.1 hypothetical protein F1728_22000 [Gimesia benthica]